jgi:hypothetical protein
MNIANSSAIFLLPHQDDEVGIFQKIVDELNDGNKVFCLYFTRSLDDKKNGIRELESLNVLLEYGVKRENVLFVGRLLGIEDKNLCLHILKAKKWLDDWLSTRPFISNIYVPAWEGGHPDHDCLNAIAATLTKQEDFKNRVWQFPLYNSNKCFPYFYRIQSILCENGALKTGRISFRNRFRFMRSCLKYPSEWLAWLGLFPFFFFNYIFIGKQLLQPVQIKRLEHRPHSGKLYYEVRNFKTWQEIFDATRSLPR